MRLKNNTPTLEEYIYLCASVGWADYMNFEAEEILLRNSIHCLTVRDQSHVVGMGPSISMFKISWFIQIIRKKVLERRSWIIGWGT